MDESLSRLGVEYIDVIQCHDIEFGSLDQIVAETIPALRRLRDQGKVRFIGITGLPLKIFSYVLDRVQVDTILSYCHCALNDPSLDTLIPFLKEKHVGIINAAPFSMGLLTRRGPPAWHPASSEIRALCARASSYCAERGEDIARLALQFSMENEGIHTTLVGTASPEHLRRNVAWLEAPRDEALLAQVREILTPIMSQTWPSGRPENN